MHDNNSNAFRIDMWVFERANENRRKETLNTNFISLKSWQRIFQMFYLQRSQYVCVCEANERMQHFRNASIYTSYSYNNNRIRWTVQQRINYMVNIYIYICVWTPFVCTCKYCINIWSDRRSCRMYVILLNLMYVLAPHAHTHIPILFKEVEKKKSALNWKCGTNFSLNKSVEKSTFNRWKS